MIILLVIAAVIMFAPQHHNSTDISPVTAEIFEVPDLKVKLSKPPKIAETYNPPAAPVAPAPQPVSNGIANTYPARLANAPVNSITDQYGMGNRQCTSYVAHKIGGGVNWWGHAKGWLGVAKQSGITVSSVPRVGSVGISTAGTYGHAVYVEQVMGGSVLVSEYNGTVSGGFATPIYSTSNFKYIYF